ncbi:hypothetical protein CN399_08685 [Bacillus cereus]|uniref:hypothetical protein n=1 Tax=Bacillus cereus TaxID=1396 RepID=UPI000BF9F3B7|nr:hypothetical protein [Bacillus cereus]PFB17022.1 hypothetical protein CN399_08685 [Bacillus cereus]
MIRVERDKDIECRCDNCGEEGTDFDLNISSEVRSFGTFGGYTFYLCEKCTAELKEKIGRFIY